MVIEEKSDKALEWEATNQTEWRIYTDGSGDKGKVGVAAVLFEGDQERGVWRYQLRSLWKHEVYDAEGIGIAMGVSAITRIPQHVDEVDVYVDSSSAIRARQLRKPAPSHYIWDATHTMLAEIK